MNLQEAGRVPTLEQLAEREGFANDFPEVARLLRGPSAASGGTSNSRGLASAALGNPHPGFGLLPSTGLAPNLIRGAPLRGEVDDEVATADKNLTLLRAKIRRADGRAKLASTLHKFINVSDHPAVRAEIAQQETHWVRVREGLVRNLERDLRANGCSSTSHLLDLGPEPATEEVTWVLAADHGEAYKGSTSHSGKAFLPSDEMAAKIAAVSLTVSTELRQIAKQRAEEVGQVATRRRGQLTEAQYDEIDSIRSDELQIMARAAIDKEALIRNTRLARKSALESSYAREMTEATFRIRQARGILARVAMSAASVDEPRLARCVLAAREAAQVEEERLGRYSADGRTDATEWARTSYTRDRGLWAVKHEMEAAHRETTELRDYLKTLWVKGAAGKPSWAGEAPTKVTGAPNVASSLEKQLLKKEALERRDIQARAYAESLQAQPWAAMTIQTPHGPAWARWPAEQYPIKLNRS